MFFIVFWLTISEFILKTPKIMVSTLNFFMVRSNFSNSWRNEVSWSFSGRYIPQKNFGTDEVNVTFVKQHSICVSSGSILRTSPFRKLNATPPNLLLTFFLGFEKIGWTPSMFYSSASWWFLIQVYVDAITSGFRVKVSVKNCKSSWFSLSDLIFSPINSIVLCRWLIHQTKKNQQLVACVFQLFEGRWANVRHVTVTFFESSFNLLFCSHS